MAKLEKVKIDAPALHAIARGADGGMRDAESTLDQLISFCGDQIEEPDVLSMFGLAAQSQILGLSQAVLAGEIQAALTQLDELAQERQGPGRLLADLLNHFRNLLIYQISRGDLNLLEVSEAEAAALKEQSGLADTGSLTRIMDVLTDTELRLRDTASKKILLEVALLKAIEARNAINLDAVLKQLNQMRGPAGGGPQPGGATASPAAAPPATRPSPKAHSALQETAAPTAPAERLPVPADLAGLWTALIEAVGRVSPFTRSYLVDANPVSFDKGILVIGFDPEFEDHLGLVDNARNHTLLQTKLAELGHANTQIKFIKIEAAAAPAAPAAKATPPNPPAATKPAAPAAKAKPAPASFNQDDFKNDPLIQKALEIFKGQIVEVRA